MGPLLLPISRTTRRVLQHDSPANLVRHWLLHWWLGPCWGLIITNNVASFHSTIDIGLLPNGNALPSQMSHVFSSTGWTHVDVSVKKHSRTNTPQKLLTEHRVVAAALWSGEHFSCIDLFPLMPLGYGLGNIFLASNCFRWLSPFQGDNWTCHTVRIVRVWYRVRPRLPTNCLASKFSRPQSHRIF